MAISKLLQSKVVLYALLVLAIINIVAYLQTRNYNALILFIAIGFLSTYFTKNMIINLTAPIILTNLFLGKRTIEGMTNNCDKCDNCEKCIDGKCEDEGCEKCGCKEGMKVKKAKKEAMKMKKEAMKAKKENMKAKKGGNVKQNFTNNKLHPASLDNEQTVTSKPKNSKGNHIDYSSTLEQAYDNLQNILGDGGMENLTDETKDLIKQQKSLMKTMQSMAPILKNANSVLSNLDMSQMSNAMGSLTSMIGNFGGEATK
jgi:hypothetical protein